MDKIRQQEREVYQAAFHPGTIQRESPYSRSEHMAMLKNQAAEMDKARNLVIKICQWIQAIIRRTIK